MDIDDVASDPERIVAEIHRQLGSIEPPVPVGDIARSLGIEAITYSPTKTFEGVLITDPERTLGVIHLNSLSSADRQRFSLGHELGHYLCGWHVGAGGNAAFSCSRRDMTEPTGTTLHDRQEREANRFAIELLAPMRMVRPFLRSLPDMEDVLRLHRSLGISKAAGARRYVSLHRETLAIVFGRQDSFEYVAKGDRFPWPALRTGDRLPNLPPVPRGERTSEMVEVDVRDWLGWNASGELAVQVLAQEEQRSMVLLHLVAAEPDDEP